MQISSGITTGHAYAILFAFLEVAAAGLLLANLCIPLALAFLAPVIAKALIFHILAEPAALPFVAIQLMLWAFLTWAYRERFRGLLTREEPKPQSQMPQTRVIVSVAAWH